MRTIRALLITTFITLFAVAADGWIGRHAGIRFELRDHIRPDHRGVTSYWSFRAGVVFKS